MDGEALKIFSSLAESLLEQKDSAVLFETITRSACTFFDASASSIMLFDQAREYLTIVHSHNLSTDYLKVVRVHRDEEIAGKVCSEQQLRFVPDVKVLFRDEGDEFTVDWVAREGLCSLVCAPLLIKGEAIGCLNIYYRTPRLTFSDEDSVNFFTRIAALAIEHTRLLSESEEKTRTLTVLEEIGLLLASSLDQDNILKVFLSAAVSVTRSDAGALVLIDEPTMKVTCAYEYEKGSELPRQYASTSRLTMGLSGEIVRTRRPVMVSNLADYGDASPVAAGKGRAAVVGIPLLAKGQITGVLYVDSLSPRVYTKNEIDFLVMLCGQASVALENTRLYNDSIREAREMALLYEVSRSFISTLDFSQLLTNILKRLVEVMGYLNMAVFLVDEEKQELRVCSYINYAEEVLNLRFKIGVSGITGHVAATRQIYYAPDVARDPYYVPGVAAAQSEVCLPLVYGDRLIGVLDVESPVRDGFSQDHINLLGNLSAQIAIALENARLFEETKRLSLTDPLTTLPNRRALELFLPSELRRAERYRRHVAVLMIDFDGFKQYNDQHGHQRGDAKLHEYCLVMKQAIRDVDFLGRYGGDEFVAVLPETDAAFALEVGERMRRAIAAQDCTPRVTLSIGVANFPGDGRDEEELLRLADAACYEAKQLGGNRVNPASTMTRPKEDA